ncbi:MAG: TlpA disulfide reductase family protein [Bacteroidota bacterium]|nr:TlpA disulfide reductase family protein [Bacteroidota bacterium]
MIKKLAFLTLIIFATSCAKRSDNTEFILTGKVINSPVEQVLISQGTNTDTIHFMEDGTFEFSDSIEIPGNFYLRFEKGSLPLYLAPGEDLNVVFDPDAIDSTINFTGSLALENEFLRKSYKLSREQSSVMRKYYEASPEAYRRGIDSLSKVENELLDNFVSKNPDMSEEFINIMRTTNEFSYYSSLLNYEGINKYYTKVDSVDLPVDWYDFLEDIDLDKPGYIKVPVSLSVINSIIYKKIEDEAGLGEDAWGTVELLEEQFDWIINNFQNQELINYFLYDNLSTHIDARGTSGAEEIIDKFLAVSTSDKDKESIKEKTEEWAPLKTGMPAPEFTLPDIAGNMVSLSDFGGKYVYLDFWATWCGPCIVKIPYLEKMAEEYRDKNIEIISISVDRDKNAWRNMLTKEPHQWLQLHDSILVNDEYLVKYIPTFVLIDREGKIIDARASRPSTGEVLTNQLDKLEGI